MVISALGSVLDGPKGAKRWDKWRPTVSLCQQEDLVVDRLELLYDPRFESLAEVVMGDIEGVSPETEVTPREIALPSPWDFERVYAELLDFARGYRFRPEKEDYLVHITTGTHVMQICFFLLVESRHVPGTLLQTAPPPKGDPESPGTFDVIDLDLERYDLLKTRFQAERDESLSFLKAGIATKNAAFNRMIEQIERVATRSRDPILLMGPTGAGKSQLARRIYELAKTHGTVEGTWVEVNCATLRGDAAMSALFGHVKGAFTGAQRDRPGLLRQADGGMLFLDEIGELGLDEQAMLLHALEDKRFLPVGADHPVEVDFTLVAGTNRDLRRSAARGEFRDDLLARLDVWTFTLPSLLERPEDIEPNLDYELERASERRGEVTTMNADARRAFLRFARSAEARWTGNFRDLSAAVLRMGTLAPQGRIDVATVQRRGRAARGGVVRAGRADARGSSGSLDRGPRRRGGGARPLRPGAARRGPPRLRRRAQPVRGGPPSLRREPQAEELAQRRRPAAEVPGPLRPRVHRSALSRSGLDHEERARRGARRSTTGERWPVGHGMSDGRLWVGERAPNDGPTAYLSGILLPVRATAYETSPPSFAAPIDVDKHIRALPPGATAKGLFFRDPLRRVQERQPGLDIFAKAGVPTRRVLPFFDYPYDELMRLLVAAAGVLHPSVPLGEGLRRLGRGAYEALIQAQVGKVLFAALGNDFSRVAAVGARGWKVSVSFGQVRFEALGDGHAAYHFSSFPAFLGTYQVGVVEGAMRICGVQGEVWTRLDGLGKGTLELFWS